MKILWLVNIVMPELAEHLGRNPSVFGGWLTGAMNAVLESGHDLIICTTERRADVLHETIGSVGYYLVPNGTVDSMEAHFRVILREEQPDIVHIYGTEFAHSWALAKCADVERTVVTIQGALKYYERAVYAGLSESLCRDTFLHKFLRKIHKGGKSIELQRLSFAKRMQYEALVINHLKYVNGGSDWGNAVAKSINPNVVTFDCKLILRDSFYNGEHWSLASCEPHSIYILYSYPIKGFHKFLEALPMILHEYPDTKVNVIANKLQTRNYSGLKKRILNAAPDYDWIIQKQIEELGVGHCLRFMGQQTELQVKELLLRSNVFISPAAIENQSTALGEAMLLGVPAVASCVGAMLEMINHGEDGLLYPFNEPYLLSAAVCKIFESDELAKRFSEKGHNHAAHTYNRDINARNLLNMYETIYSHK